MIKKFTTNLHVDKKIVSLLSKSTYQRSFVGGIREIVSNAYDADSLSVSINISSDFKNIEIVDDGNGMTQQEFEKFLTIAGTKTSTVLTRKYKRKRIGQFGVGFLSIFPFCKEIEITTKTENSDNILTATIPAIDYEEGPNNQDVADIPIFGAITEDKSQRLKHYTKIKLVKPSHAVKQYFTKMKTRKRDSVDTFNPFEKFKWELQEDLPLSFDPKGNSFKLIKYEERIGINVFLNGKPLFRNELNSHVLDEGTKKIQDIICKYIIATDYKSVAPLESRGIKQRVTNMGIGLRTDFGLRRDRGFSRLHWLSGEIYFSQEMKEHLNLNRDSFIASPVLDEINDFFAEKLKHWAYYVEDVGVAEKAISQTIKDTKKGRVVPRKEEIKKNIEKLEKRGYEIKKVKKDNSSTSDRQVVIDKSKKIVTVIEDEDFDRDYIKILGKKYEIIFTSEFKDAVTPCRMIKRNIIELNSNYPFFKSKTYGKLYQRMHILLFIAEEENRSAKDMYHYILNNFSNELSDFT